MHCYRVEFTYMVRDTKRRTTDIFVGFNCQEAVDSCRAIYGEDDEYPNLRIERVWKECYGSWMAVNAWN